MKTKNILAVLTLLLIIQITKAQITPIETIVSANKTIYSTNLHNNYKLTIKNQSYDLKLKLQENMKISDNINPLFIKECLNEATFITLGDNKVTLVIEYVINQNGKVYSCSLINYGNKVSLSNTEVKCILTEAMDNTFSFNNVPNGINKFYSRVRKHFKF